jgi:D-glycero-alpha-D-manno-heptose-7-phosphate kinase
LALKRGLASSETSIELDEVFDSCLRAGAVGGKLLGAGGGGFLLMFVPTGVRDEFFNRVKTLVSAPVGLESKTLRVLSAVG